MPRSDGLAAAIRAWRRAIGSAHVLVDPSARSAAETATFATSQRVPVILQPKTTAEVQSCVRVAARHGVPVYPTSRGKNWGYGSKVPASTGCALLELDRLDRIVAFDERLAYVVVEPGVTFAQLGAFLEKRGSRLYVNATGSTPHSSALANALERGLGRGPMGDRFAASCALEVVLADGERVRTGFGQFPGTGAEHLHRSGVGPTFDGLFSQSNLGIVTQMTLWLTPRAPLTDDLLARMDGGRQLARFVDRIQRLYLEGSLRGPLKIINAYRLLAGHMQYPWTLAGGRVPFRGAPARMLLNALDISPWTASSALEHRTTAMRRAQRALLREAIAPGVRSFRMAPAGSHEGESQEEPDRLSAYWRKKMPPPARPSPERDRCGIFFTAPVVPLRGRDVVGAARCVERELFDAGFEPMMTFTVMDPRVAYLVAPLFYDRDVAGEDERARRCVERLHRRLAAQGYRPYRLGIHAHDTLAAMRGADQRLHARLKNALDPGRILAPGRYEALGPDPVTGDTRRSP